MLTTVNSVGNRFVPKPAIEQVFTIAQTSISWSESKMTGTISMSEPSAAKLQLALGTGAFALCFAVFGSMSAMMPIISRHMALTDEEVLRRLGFT